jgi:hypothetical protein
VPAITDAAMADWGGSKVTAPRRDVCAVPGYRFDPTAPPIRKAIAIRPKSIGPYSAIGATCVLTVTCCEGR